MNSRKCELLTLRKHTQVDTLIESVPKPKNAVPKNGLPLWAHLPLDAKLPVLGGPKKELWFTRDKIGRKLWQNATQNDFDLSDPNCLDVSYDYDSLHDSNLRRFFQNKVNRRRMLDNGFINTCGDAICSLKDYNNYRRYLKRVHMDAINVERVKMELKGMERFLIRKAREDEERDLMIHARKRIRKVKMRNRNAMLEEEARQKEERLAQNQIRHALRLQTIEQKKEEDLKFRMDKALAFEMKIKQRNQQAQEIERKRKIKALRKWHDSEVARRRRMAKERYKKRTEKEWNQYHHLNQKVKCQNDRMERQANMLNHYQREMAVRAELRTKDVEYKRLKMEDKLMKLKAERVRNSSEKAWSIKAMVRALCNAWEDRLKNKSPEQAEAERAIIEKTIQLQMAEFKHKSEGKEVLAILQGAKRKLDKLFGLPEPVSLAMDSMLNTSIVLYVKKKVEQVLNETVDQAATFQRQLDEAIQEHNRKKMAIGQKSSEAGSSPPGERRRASIRPGVDVIKPGQTAAMTRELSKTKARSTTRSASWGSIGQPQRLVSFGQIVTIDKMKAMAKAGNDEGKAEGEGGQAETIPEDTVLMRRTKDRPPTPVPSLTELVDAAFNDPVNLESLLEADSEKKRLDQQIADFSQKLLKVVLKKADMSAERKKKQLYRQLSNLYLDTEIVVTRITEAILYSEEPNLMDLPEVDHISNCLAKDLIVKRTADMFPTSAQVPPANAKPPSRSSKSGVVKKLVLMDK